MVLSMEIRARFIGDISVETASNKLRFAQKSYRKKNHSSPRSQERGEKFYLRKTFLRLFTVIICALHYIDIL